MREHYFDSRWYRRRSDCSTKSNQSGISKNGEKYDNTRKAKTN